VKIVVSNQKGGVGKTTTVVNLGAALIERGESVVYIDMDPQGGLTTHLGFNPFSFERTVYDVLIGQASIGEVAVKTLNYTLIPANLDLAAAEVELLNEIGREFLLRDILREVKADYILIDTPPSLGLLTINALTAADGVIIPMETQYLALRGLQLLLKIIKKVQDRANPSLKILGILPTMVDRTVHTKEVIEEIQVALGDHIPILPPVKRSVRFPESSVAGKSILEYDRKTNGAKSYIQLAEVLTGWQSVKKEA
jgi:chromosome partitioning protein